MDWELRRMEDQLSQHQDLLQPPKHLNLSYNYYDFMENISRLLNNSDTKLDPHILAKYASNRNVDSTAAFYGLILAYSLLIILGACGNGLVVIAVARKPAMRTARNLFIVNLAVSDMLLCLITMPLTLMEILTRYWPLGRQDFVCKMLGTMQALSIFVSTISITAIALDRYHVIVYPTREALQVVGAVGILGAIWVVAFILAAPLFVWRTLKVHVINLESIGIKSIAYCLEDWPIQHGRVYYSLFSLIFQYVLPIITVSVAYSRICRKLHYRYVRSTVGARSSCKEKCRKEKDDRRMRRTNSLLVSISLIFCISWLPLNIYNLVVDFYNPFGDDRQTMMVVYAICHMIGMSSACSNPLLYGWLNDNFRKEFKEILSTFCPWIPVEAVQERVNSLRSSLKESRRKRRAEKNANIEVGAGTTTAAAAGGATGEGGINNSVPAKSTGPDDESQMMIGGHDSQLLTIPAAAITSAAVSGDLRRAGSNTSNASGGRSSRKAANETTQVAYRKALDTTMVVAENISGLTEMTVITGIHSHSNV